MTSPLNAEGFYLKPYMGTVLIKPDSAPSQTESGILLPATITKNSSEGLVLDVGMGWWSDALGELVGMGIFAGDRVIYDERLQLKIARGDKDYILISYKGILGITDPTGQRAWRAGIEKKLEEEAAEKAALPAPDYIPPTSPVNG